MCLAARRRRRRKRKRRMTIMRTSILGTVSSNRTKAGPLLGKRLLADEVGSMTGTTRGQAVGPAAAETTTIMTRQRKDETLTEAVAEMDEPAAIGMDEPVGVVMDEPPWIGTDERTAAAGGEVR